MVRKFLYLIAILIVLALAALVAMRVWAPELTRLAYVPTTKFVAQEPLAATIYDDPKMWIARPGMGPTSPAAWIPDGWTERATASPAAVFFIHPTSYLAREHWNAPLEDAESQNRAKLFVRGMASPFNQSVDLWAPRYRQAAFGAFLTESDDSRNAINAAFADVERAFDYFLTHTSNDAPIILAGHSQGALHLIRLLKERVAGTPLAGRIVAAYVIGWPISVEHDLPALGLPACAAAGQPGCIVSWSSFAEPADPSILMESYSASVGLDGTPRGTSAMLCTNPLTGGIGGEAPATANAGTLVPTDDLTGGTVTKNVAAAKCDDSGLLLIGPPPEMGPFVLPGNNYHVYDIPLFWANLRLDVAGRTAAWVKAR